MTKYIFIAGIPAAGKSTLADEVSRETGFTKISLDHLRLEMEKDPELKPWVNFLADKDEKEYWNKTACNEHWINLKKQSEAFWPTCLKIVEETLASGKSAIFEGVNILPHLAAKDLDFPGIYLIGDSFETILERNKKSPRWGKTEELQKKEAEVFFHCEGPKYKEEAELYGYGVFSDYDKAKVELLKLIRI